MLRTLAIDASKEFKPDEQTCVALKTARQEAHAWSMDRLVTYSQPNWPASKWDLVLPIGPKSGLTWQSDNVLDVDARGVALFSFFCPLKKLGAGQQQLSLI
jgi:hypothetical protein